ncbi:hypothetical protein ES703_101138 [subsurface metagenome]
MASATTEVSWEKRTGGKEAGEFKRYIGDRQFLESLREELLNKYPEQWVAIYTRELVASAKSLPMLVKLLEQRRITPSKAAIDFLTSRKMAMIL